MNDDHDAERSIEEIARRQDGAFNRIQVLRVGGTKSMISTRLGTGAWVRLESGVYSLASAPGTYRRQCWAAVLGNPGAGVGGLSAGALLGFEGVRPGGVEIVMPATSNARDTLARIHRYDGAALTTLKGLPITTRAQTIFDIAYRLGFERLEAVVDTELLTNRIVVDDLIERLSFYDGARRAGLPLMRAVIDDRRSDGFVPSESELERKTDRVLAKLAGHPEIERQVSFPWLRAGRARVDRYLPHDGIVLEVDGRRWHARLESFDEDRWRDNLVVAHGLVPLRFSWVHVTRRPAEVLAVIEQTRAIRRAA